VKVDTAGGNDFQERERSENSFQPRDSSGRRREQLHQWRSSLVRSEHLRGTGAARHAGDPQCCGGLYHIYVDHRGNEKAGPRLDGSMSVICSQYRACTDHDIRELFRDAPDVLQCVWNRQRELADAKSTSDGAAHRLCCEIPVRSSQDGARTRLTEQFEKLIWLHAPDGQASSSISGGNLPPGGHDAGRRCSVQPNQGWELPVSGPEISTLIHVIVAFFIAGTLLFQWRAVHPVLSSHIGATILIVTGLYQFMAVGMPKADFQKTLEASGPAYHMLAGIKMMLAIAALFIAGAMVGRSGLMVKIRQSASKWLSLGIVLVIAVIAISRYLAQMPSG